MPAEKQESKGRYTSFFENINKILVQMAPDPNRDDESVIHSAFSAGEMAELRRMHPEKDEARPPIFWKILCRYGVIGNLSNEQIIKSGEERRWAAVLQGMALTAELCRDVGKDENFGKALGSAEENGDSLSKRFDQLMRATPERFIDLLRHMLKLAISKNCAFSWVSLAALILTVDEHKRSQIRKGLTQSFYISQEKKQFADPNGQTASNTQLTKEIDY